MGNSFNAEAILDTQHGKARYWRLHALEEAGLCNLSELPYSIRILLESVLRQVNLSGFTNEDILQLVAWDPTSKDRASVPFLPARVVMQDFTGVPAVVDLAAMRSALAKAGVEPSLINPVIPVDLVIDHSVQVDFFATPDALQRNAEIEFQRNQERYEFLRWGQDAFQNFRVVPPATGIVHQVNLEFLADVVQIRKYGESLIAMPDSLVGTDSHTTMINSLGVLGWGVGGIEAEAAMLGQPLVMPAPDVVGVRITGELSEGVTATDLVLTVTEILRHHGVVGKFVEFFGAGLMCMSLPDRATVANMAPEYGATMGYFPVDDMTLEYLHFSGRDKNDVDLVEKYFKTQGLFREHDSPEPNYSDVLALDLSSIEPSLAGPRRPQDRIALSDMQSTFRQHLVATPDEGGFGLSKSEVAKTAVLKTKRGDQQIGHGSVVIAAITSCTNTSNPDVMIAAGVLAKKAVELGLKVPPSVKTSLAPGSTVVTEYLRAGGLLEPLTKLGFNVVGYGCTTCIGNSGPLPGEVIKAISEEDLVSVAVLSGNRNFEGRINPHVKANYLASPPLVVAYALAGRVNIDFSSEPLGVRENGVEIFLREIWPSKEEVQSVLRQSLSPDLFISRYSDVFAGNEIWNNIPVAGGALNEWKSESTYIQEPPFFKSLQLGLPLLGDIRGARILALLGDSVTTDHISPAGAIPMESPAGQYLLSRDVQPRDFNSFGARRGNDQIMTRGTFGNIRLRNLLLPGVEGGETIHFPSEDRMSIFEAAMRYGEDKVPLVVFAGKEYGTGSSRDWAAKGTLLLGVQAVIAESFERIHRSNLVGMGVLPLQFLPGESVESIGITGREVIHILDIEERLQPGGTVRIQLQETGEVHNQFKATIRIDTELEIDYYRNGGILPTVLRQMMASGEQFS